MIGVEREHFFYEGVTEDVRRAVEEVLDVLGPVGATVVDVDLPEFDWSPEVLMTIMAAESSTFHRRRLRERHATTTLPRAALSEMGEFIPATHYLTGTTGPGACCGTAWRTCLRRIGSMPCSRRRCR